MIEVRTAVIHGAVVIGQHSAAHVIVRQGRKAQGCLGRPAGRENDEHLYVLASCCNRRRDVRGCSGDQFGSDAVIRGMLHGPARADRVCLHCNATRLLSCTSSQGDATDRPGCPAGARLDHEVVLALVGQ